MSAPRIGLLAPPIPNPLPPGEGDKSIIFTKSCIDFLHVGNDLIL